MRLKRKRALVTGGASGIGYGIVERFLQEGAAVAFCDINAEACSVALGQLSSNGRNVKGLVGDVSKSADARCIVEEAVAHLGGLDILVNNAGIATHGTILETSDEVWDRQMAVSLDGVFRMSKHAVPAIIKAGGGAIVNIGSIGGFLGFKGIAAYCTAKGAVVQLTRNMAADFAEYKVRVNSVNPGAVLTPMIEESLKVQAGLGGDWQAVKQALVEGQLFQRTATPAEIASAVLFLASDEAGFITGTALMVDGGYQIKA
jgi:NAD(P)-dependent dehydrogenase (short-subunit alcohol dehydrogenase family)